MGCDFYTYYVVRIEYKKGEETKVKSEEIEDTRERHYFWASDKRDEDFEELNDYYDRCELQHQQQVKEMLREYPKKSLKMVNGYVWRVQKKNTLIYVKNMELLKMM